jgi:hypothetical protein
VIGLLWIVGQGLPRLRFRRDQVVALEEDLGLLKRRGCAQHALNVFRLLCLAPRATQLLVVLAALREIGQHLAGLGHPREDAAGRFPEIGKLRRNTIRVPLLGQRQERRLHVGLGHVFGKAQNLVEGFVHAIGAGRNLGA